MANCRVCAQPFVQRNSMQSVCGIDCARRLPIINRKAAQAEKRKTKQRLADLRPRSWYLKEAQREFNVYIRERDRELPCVSCGRIHEGQWHAGHYLSTGARPELRFCEDNVHKQCQPCNTHLHGNLVLFRSELVNRIGLANLSALEAHHEPKHYTIPDLKALAIKYRGLTKAMKEED